MGADICISYQPRGRPEAGVRVKISVRITYDASRSGVGHLKGSDVPRKRSNLGSSSDNFAPGSSVHSSSRGIGWSFVRARSYSQKMEWSR